MEGNTVWGIPAIRTVRHPRKTNIYEMGVSGIELNSEIRNVDCVQPVIISRGACLLF